MLKQRAVDEQEEQLRACVGQLEDADRQQFYAEVKHLVRDPDTYAALNWFFIAGLHHFYLGKWWMGLLDLVLFVTGVLLILSGHAAAGILLILLVSAFELWALFRSQIIIQDWNNQIYARLLEKYQGSAR